MYIFITNFKISLIKIFNIFFNKIVVTITDCKATTKMIFSQHVVWEKTLLFSPVSVNCTHCVIHSWYIAFVKKGLTMNWLYGFGEIVLNSILSRQGNVINMETYLFSEQPNYLYYFWTFICGKKFFESCECIFSINLIFFSVLGCIWEFLV